MQVRVPIKVYAELEGKWSMIILLNPHDGNVPLDRDGTHIVMPAFEVLKRDLLWPNGRRLDMKQIV